ncbi:hypothetical protein EMIT0P2_30511 [Pseudomonas sp. IT-P2]
MLPHLVAIRHLRHAQTVGQDRLNVGLVRQAVGKAHHNARAFLRKGINAHVLATPGDLQRRPGGKKLSAQLLTNPSPFPNCEIRMGTPTKIQSLICSAEQFRNKALIADPLLRRTLPPRPKPPYEAESNM